MPAAAVIRRVQALSGITGFKGCVGGVVIRGESPQLNCGIAFDTAVLESGRGRQNVTCSGEMHRYVIEHQLRRQLARPVLTLRHESVGSEQD